jgi:hypothetical protein
VAIDAMAAAAMDELAPLTAAIAARRAQMQSGAQFFGPSIPVPD